MLESVHARFFEPSQYHVQGMYEEIRDDPVETERPKDQDSKSKIKICGRLEQGYGKEECDEHSQKDEDCEEEFDG